MCVFTKMLMALCAAMITSATAFAQSPSPPATKSAASTAGSPSKSANKGARIVIYWEQAPINQLFPGLVPKWMSGRADIEVDGKPAAKLGWGEVVKVSVSPGIHYVRHDTGLNLFGFKGMEFKVGAGQTVYLRAYKEQYNIFFSQVSSSRAAKDLTELKKGS